MDMIALVNGLYTLVGWLYTFATLIMLVFPFILKRSDEKLLALVGGFVLIFFVFPLIDAYAYDEIKDKWINGQHQQAYEQYIRMLDSPMRAIIRHGQTVQISLDDSNIASYRVGYNLCVVDVSCVPPDLFIDLCIKEGILERSLPKKIDLTKIYCTGR